MQRGSFDRETLGRSQRIGIAIHAGCDPKVGYFHLYKLMHATGRGRLCGILMLSWRLLTKSLSKAIHLVHSLMENGHDPDVAV